MFQARRAAMPFFTMAPAETGVDHHVIAVRTELVIVRGDSWRECREGSRRCAVVLVRELPGHNSRVVGLAECGHTHVSAAR